MGGRHAGRPALIALFAAAAVATPAQAQKSDCATLRALTNADGRKFADLRFDVDSRSDLTVRVGRGKPDLADPEECELSYSALGIEISCEWRFPNYAAASAFFDPLLEKMRRCLNVPLPSTEIASRTPGWMALRRNEADHTAGKGETHVELSLIEYTPDDPASGGVTYYVDLQSGWDPD